MSFCQNIVVTGATGFIGSHFLYAVLRHAPSVRITALVRGSCLVTARERLIEKLSLAADAYHDAEPLCFERLTVVLGDISEPVCGVSDAQLRTLQQGEAPTFLHMAASLEFEESHRERVLRLNVDGTRQAMALAARLSAQRFVYVSTAYTCGQQVGAIAEQLHDPSGPFNNVYEYSKCKAEQLVASSCQLRAMPWTILRPSIVTGPMATYRTGGSDTGLYGFVREMYRARRTLMQSHGAQLLGEPDCPVNLIPVDRVAQRMLQLHRTNYEGSTIRHLTSDHSPTVETLLNVVSIECGIPQLQVARVRERAAAPIERLFDRRLEFYSGYLKGSKTFTNSDAANSGVSRNSLQLFVRAAIRERQASGNDVSCKRSLLASFDGFPLNVYEGGCPSGETVILINALGLTQEMFGPLWAELGRRFRLITWDSRGVPSNSGQMGDAEARFECHHNDLMHIAQHFNVARFHLLGYCTGADVALHTASAEPLRTISLSLVNGASCNNREQQTDFQRSLWAVIPELARSRRQAEIHHALLFGQERDNAEATEHWNNLVDALDPALIHLTNLPFQNAESLHRYAKLLSAFRDAPEQSRPPRCPTLVVTSDNDRLAHPEASRRRASKLGAVLRSFPELGHFGIHTSSRCRSAIADFLAQCAVDDQHVAA